MLVVDHGAGEVVFDLDGDCLISDVLYCSPRNRGCEDQEDAGPDGSTGAQPVESLVCELWTDGAAQVTVTASSYPMLAKTLVAKSNGTCIETVDVELMLERGDARP